MQTIYAHIENYYPGVVFSPVYYRQSDNAGVLNQNYTNEGARGIVYHYIYWDLSQLTPPPATTFSDQFNQPLFTTAAVQTGWAPIPMVIDGPQMRIFCNQAILFSVCFQLLLNPTLKETVKK